MQKKNDLQASFKSRKEKVGLSVADIDRIAEQVEKPAVVVKPTVQPTAEPIAPPIIQPTPKPKVVAAKPTPKTIIAEEEMETVKTSLDFPVSIYEDMKISLFRKRRSMKDYIIDLVRQDLYGSK
jgi:hypothetical protein